MKHYVEIPTESAHRLINHGPLVLVSTRGKNGVYDVAPIAWNSPVHKSPPMMLVVVGKRHQTHENIEHANGFIVVVPHADQLELVRRTGSVSGRDADKFKQFGIETLRGHHVDALVPQDCVGFIECEVAQTIGIHQVSVFAGKVVSASADEEAFDQRLLSESSAGKTLHHLGGSTFSVPSDRLMGWQ